MKAENWTLEAYRKQYKTGGENMKTFLYYEDGTEKHITMRKAYSQFCTMVDGNQKEQGTTFHSWLDEMIAMNIFVVCEH